MVWVVARVAAGVVVGRRARAVVRIGADGALTGDVPIRAVGALDRVGSHVGSVRAGRALVLRTVFVGQIVARRTVRTGRAAVHRLAVGIPGAGALTASVIGIGADDALALDEGVAAVGIADRVRTDVAALGTRGILVVSAVVLGQVVAAGAVGARGTPVDRLALLVPGPGLGDVADRRARRRGVGRVTRTRAPRDNETE